MPAESALELLGSGSQSEQVGDAHGGIRVETVIQSQHIFARNERERKRKSSFQSVVRNKKQNFTFFTRIEVLWPDRILVNLGTRIHKN